MQINWLILILFIIGCNLLGAIGTFWTNADSDWYNNLNKPPFNPPSWLFAPVWIFLFSLMGIALYFVFFSSSSQVRTIALVLFVIQFVLNILWNYLFFGAHNPLFALIEIVFLLILIILTSVYFFKSNILSGALMIPYVLWVGFASFLNYSIWRIN